MNTPSNRSPRPGALTALLAVTFLALALAALPAQAATFTVANMNDAGSGSLRQAVLDASAVAGADTINFAGGLTGATIPLNSEIVIGSDVTMDARSLPDGLTVDGGPGSNRIFYVNPNTTVSLFNLTLTGGNGAGATFSGEGGAILNQGTLALAGCTLYGNSAPGHGGALNSYLGTNTLTQCTFASNSAGASGGAIAVNTASLTLLHCTLSGNSSATDGGAINNYLSSSALRLNNCIAAGNTAPNGPNLLGAFDGSHNLTSDDPLLAPLADNGGPTRTMALQPDSPAINAAVGSTISTDQRGFPIVGTPDIGAFESQPFPTVSFGDNISYEGTLFPFTVSLSAASAIPVTVDYATADGSARAGSDYAATSGTLTFAPGEISKTIIVTVYGDTAVEEPETFLVILSNPVNANLGHVASVVIILDDDIVVAGPSTTTLTASVNPATAGELVTFTATVGAVAPAVGTPTGTVSFLVDGAALPGGSNVPLLNGMAAFSTTGLAVGTHTITAAYSGEAQFHPSTSGSQSLIVHPQLSACAGNALDLAGGFAETPHAEELNALPLTVTAWINTSNNDGVPRGIVNKYVASSGNGYQIYLANGRVYAWYFGDWANNVWDGGLGLDGGSVSDGQWHHVAFTVDASGGKLYVDGTEQDTQTWNGTATAITTSEPLRIGRYPGEANFIGHIDEVAIWNAARSQTEIQAGMNKSLFGNEPGLLAYYRFNEAGGPLADSAGGGTHPATLSGNASLAPSTAPIFCLVVTTTADSGPGSLRQAIADVPSGGTITFAPALNGQTITLTSGTLLIPKSMTIQGPGAGLLTVSGNNARRILSVTNHVLHVSGLTLADGVASGDDLFRFTSGGALRIHDARVRMEDCVVTRCRSIDGAISLTSSSAPVPAGQLILRRCNVIANTNQVADRTAGGITILRGRLEAQDCLFANNVTVGEGGALKLEEGAATAYLVNTLLTNNTARSYGGAIQTYRGKVDLCNSTVAGNRSGTEGGGVWVGDAPGMLRATNSTFSHNHARRGGGLASSAIVPSLGGGTNWLVHVTLAGNVATNQADGIYVASGKFFLQNTLLASAGSNSNCVSSDSGTIVSLGHNLSDDNSCVAVLNQPGDLNNVPALLGPLANYGGSTFTHALQPGSPAINAGANASAAGLATDQRGPGFPRLVGGTVDIGAYEAGTYSNCNAYVWERLPATATEAEHAATYDYDHDGAPNCDEWTAGTDPASPTSVLRITRVEAVDPEIWVTFPTVPGREYGLDYSPDLQSWSVLGWGIRGTGGDHTFRVSGGPQVFLRVVVRFLP